MSSDFALVTVFNNDVEAGTARSLLESRGLDAFVWKDDAGGLYPFLQSSWGVRLVVPRDQLETALAVLADAGIHVSRETPDVPPQEAPPS